MKVEPFVDRIVHGACLDVMPQIPDDSVDLVLCDLPYGTTKCRWDAAIPFEPLWREYWRVVKPGAAIVLTATQPFTAALVMNQVRFFKHEWVWQKSKSGSAFTAKSRPMAKHESILVFGRGRVTYNPQMREGEPYSRTRKTPPINNHEIGFGRSSESTTINVGTRYPDSVIYFQQKWRRQDQLHPTQKPVELFRYLIRTYSNPGAIVLDNCIGSGTTAVAALAEGRHFIGIEKELEYFDIAQNRVKELISCQEN